MTTKIGENFLLYKITKEIWDSTRETYSSVDNTSELFDIETRLQNLQQGELNNTQYFNILSKHWREESMEGRK